jgi:hypothetical protein
MSIDHASNERMLDRIDSFTTFKDLTELENGLVWTSCKWQCQIEQTIREQRQNKNRQTDEEVALIKERQRLRQEKIDDLQLEINAIRRRKNQLAMEHPVEWEQEVREFYMKNKASEPFLKI